MARPTCLTCGAPLRKPRHQTFVLTADGRPPERGDYGDNAFCTERCGYFFALRVLRSIGVEDAVRMLPTVMQRAALADEYRESKDYNAGGYQRVKKIRRHRDHDYHELRKNNRGEWEHVRVEAPNETEEQT